MSLIEEALRRLQDPLLPTPHKATATPRPTAAPPQQPAEPKPVHPWPTTADTQAAPTPALQQAPVLIATGAILLIIAMLLVGKVQWKESADGPSQPEPSSSITSGPVVGATSGVTSPAGGARPSGASQPTDGARPTREAQGTSNKKRASQAQDQLILSGVVEGRGQHYALINGAVVAVGEQIGGFTLLEATQGAARLRRADGSELVLRVPR